MQSSNYEEHDLAIVYLETAFEVYLQQLLIAKYRANGTMTLYDTRNKCQALTEDVIAGENVSDLMRRVKNLTNKDAKLTNEHSDWDTKVYKRRNGITHRGNTGTTETEFGEALDAARNFMQWLKAAVQ